MCLQFVVGWGGEHRAANDPTVAMVERSELILRPPVCNYLLIAIAMHLNIPPRIAWSGYLLLLAVGVPWYWEWFPETAARLVLGMPVWAAVSLAASAAASFWTVLLLAQKWPEERAGDADEAG